MDVLIQLWPSLLLASILKLFSGRIIIFWFLTLPGTIIHEFWHWLIGSITVAQPTKLTVFPRRDVDGYIFGSVLFSNIRWFNGVFVGLAPLLSFGLFWLMGVWLAGEPRMDFWLDFAAWYVMACLLLSGLPSKADIWIALHSWPYLPLAILSYVWIDWQHIRTFF